MDGGIEMNEDSFNLTMEYVSDNADGSCNVMLHMDDRATKYIINYGFVAMLRDAIASKKLVIEDEMKAGGTE